MPCGCWGEPVLPTPRSAHDISALHGAEAALDEALAGEGTGSPDVAAHQRPVAPDVAAHEDAAGPDDGCAQQVIAPYTCHAGTRSVSTSPELSSAVSGCATPRAPVRPRLAPLHNMLTCNSSRRHSTPATPVARSRHSSVLAEAQSESSGVRSWADRLRRSFNLDKQRSIVQPVARHRRKSQLGMPASPTALDAAVTAIREACQEKGGLSVLHDCAPNGTATVPDFCSFCVGTLQLEPHVPLVLCDLVDTSNDIVRMYKLISVIKATSALNSRRSTQMERCSLGVPGADSPITSSRGTESVLHPESSPSLMAFGSGASAAIVHMLNRLASLLDMQVADLRAALAHAGVDPTNRESRQAFRSLVHELIATEGQLVRLPQGLEAPFVAAHNKEGSLGYSVPVWSLRAMHQKARPSVKLKHMSTGELIALLQRRATASLC
jgi:hypothetical protein